VKSIALHRRRIIRSTSRIRGAALPGMGGPRRRGRTWRVAVLLSLVLAAPVTSHAQLAYEASYRYLGDYPQDANPGFHEDVQGVGHDDAHWYFTNTDSIWKVPVDVALDQDLGDVSGVLVRYLNLADMPGLAAAGYNHLGDPEAFEFDGQWYLFVAVEGPAPHVIAVYRCSDLALLDFAPVPNQEEAPWCALDPQGRVVSSRFSPFHGIRRYSVDWPELRDSHTLNFVGEEFINLFDGSGDGIAINSVQGGVFSPSGQHLYIVAGTSNSTDPTHGIHVFDMQTLRRVRRSTNGSGLFNYAFETGGIDYEEAEGCTYWDLDNGAAPNVRGQLHVFLLDNDLSADEIYFKHYSQRIWVSAGSIGDGTIGAPFPTVSAAVALAESNNWDGCEIRLHAAAYPETVTISVRTKLQAVGGLVRIGVP
jgi:hypothetical protein